MHFFIYYLLVGMLLVLLGSLLWIPLFPLLQRSEELHILITESPVSTLFGIAFILIATGCLLILLFLWIVQLFKR